MGVIFERMQVMDVPPEHVVVVEINPDVIELVASTYTDYLPWLEVVQGDIWEWPKTGPKNYFDTAWMDIWANYNESFLPEMYALRRQVRRVMRPGLDRVKIWKEDELKYVKRRGTDWRL